MIVSQNCLTLGDEQCRESNDFKRGLDHCSKLHRRPLNMTVCNYLLRNSPQPRTEWSWESIQGNTTYTPYICHTAPQRLLKSGRKEETEPGLAPWGLLAVPVPSGSRSTPQSLQHHASVSVGKPSLCGAAAQPSASPGTSHEKNIWNLKFKLNKTSTQAQPQESPVWPEDNPVPSSM